MVIRQEKFEGKRVFSFSETSLSVSAGNVEKLETEFLSCGDDTVLDMANVTYCDSYFLGITLAFLKKYGRDKLKLVNVNDTVNGIINITGFDNFLHID
jgi:anti-anti-sigma factor